MTLDARLYYHTPTSLPVLVEVMLGEWICVCGDEGWQPISKFPGRFVRLQPVEVYPEDSRLDHHRIVSG